VICVVHNPVLTGLRACFVISSRAERGIVARELGQGTRGVAQGCAHAWFDPSRLATTVHRELFEQADPPATHSGMAQLLTAI